jgi:AraC-like DNA-binding protein
MSQKITAPETLSKTQERILAWLREHPQATRAEVARGLGLSRETVSRLVNEEQFIARVETLHEDILGDAADMASLAALAHRSLRSSSRVGSGRGDRRRTLHRHCQVALRSPAPDVARLGGTITFRQDEQVNVMLPREALAALRTDPLVRYVQRLQETLL